eukprot:COSAG04_NODE_184_length_21108_cov_56.740492_13_plen_343_part_00
MSSFREEMAAKRALASRALPAGFPSLGAAGLAARLEPPPAGRVAMVLDTDTFNEIDDQFAIVQALLSPERLDLRAIYAAPFYNTRSDSPGDGMEKSYDEILELLQRMDVEPEGLVHRGSTEILQDWDHPVPSPAASDLVAQAKAMPEGELLYVVAIACITNVASAILMEPSIIEKIVVVWLGGTANDWPTNLEYNLQGDLKAAQLVMDCGVPLVRLPCAGVVTHLHSSIPEIDTYVKGKGAIGDFLAMRFREYAGGEANEMGWTKQIWDMAAVAWVIDDSWIPTVLEATPLLTNDYTWSFDGGRHLNRTSTAAMNRDGIMRDFFVKLDAFAKQPGTAPSSKL